MPSNMRIRKILRTLACSWFNKANSIFMAERRQSKEIDLIWFELILDFSAFTLLAFRARSVSTGLDWGWLSCIPDTLDLYPVDATSTMASPPGIMSLHISKCFLVDKITLVEKHRFNQVFPKGFHPRISYKIVINTKIRQLETHYWKIP